MMSGGCEGQILHMLQQRRILIVSADRAEKGLLTPVFDELCKRDDVTVAWSELNSHDDAITNLLRFRETLDAFNPDIVLAPCDRSEMTYVAAYVFHRGIILSQFHAGNNCTNHPDDINRKVISSFSHILFCNMEEHKQNLIKQGEEDWRIHVVGSTAFDGVIYDLTVTPTEPFTVVILHPDPSSKEKTERDLQTILSYVNNETRVIWIYPNHDKNFEVIESYLDRLHQGFLEQDKNKYYFGPAIELYRTLPRSQYLSLLKRCTKVIGNSSSFYYEVPVLNPKAELLQIGERNRGLIVPSTITGGSERIAKILATIKIDDKLRNKWLV